MFAPPEEYTENFEDDDFLTNLEYCQRYFHKVPVSNQKIVYIDPKVPHHMYSPDQAQRMKCVTARYFLQDKEPHVLLKATDVVPCLATPRSNDDEHHAADILHGGPKPNEIGLLYFKWAMRLQCAEPTTENSFSARKQLVKQVRTYMLRYEVPDREISRTFFRCFNSDQLTRATESVNKKCSETRRVFPQPISEQIAGMRFNRCKWNNTPIAPVDDESTDEEQPDEENPGDSEGASANPEEARDSPQPGPSTRHRSPTRSNISSVSDDNGTPRNSGQNLDAFIPLTPLPITPVRLSTPNFGFPLQLTPINNPTHRPLPELLGDLFTPPRAPEYQEISV